MRTKKDVLNFAITFGLLAMVHGFYYFAFEPIAQEIASEISSYIVVFKENGLFSLLLFYRPWVVLKLMLLSVFFAFAIKVLLQLDLRLLFPKKYAKDDIYVYAPPRTGKSIGLARDIKQKYARALRK